MRPLPLNLRDTYGHVRMAVYSAGLDVEIRSADHLPNGMMGCYSERTRTILIDRRLPYVAKRCTLVHELVHWSHGDDRCGLHEMRTRAETARLLISPTEYALAERMYDGNVWRIADELEVTSGIINDYRTSARLYIRLTNDEMTPVCQSPKDNPSPSPEYSSGMSPKRTIGIMSVESVAHERPHFPRMDYPPIDVAGSISPTSYAERYGQDAVSIFQCCEFRNRIAGKIVVFGVSFNAKA